MRNLRFKKQIATLVLLCLPCLLIPIMLSIRESRERVQATQARLALRLNQQDQRKRAELQTALQKCSTPNAVLAVLHDFNCVDINDYSWGDTRTISGRRSPDDLVKPARDSDAGRMIGITVVFKTNQPPQVLVILGLGVA